LVVLSPGPCNQCCLLTAKEAKAKFDCWDAKKCPRRRWDAKNKASRNERHVRNYRKQSVKAHIEKVGGEALIYAAKFADVASILERDAALLFDPTEAFYAEVERAIDVLREASERLTLGKAETAHSAGVRARLIAAHQKAEAGTQPISRVIGTAAIAYLYTVDGTRGSPPHAMTIELWNQQKCLDTRHQHLFDLKPTQIRTWLDGVLSDWRIPRLAEPEPRIRSSLECPLRPCPLHQEE
jgi:hypothetical protein